MRVLAVWQPMLPTDTGAPTTRTLARLSDPRVRQYHDADRLLAQRLGADARSPQPEPDCCRRGGILWDLLAAYPAGALWSERLPVAVIFNGPVVDVTGPLDDLLKAAATDAR